jgi:CHAD domain-containing protein
MSRDLFIRQRLVALTEALPGARKGEASSVHQARVSTRRLRAALPLIASGGPRRKLERIARELTRALGPVRELDVALEMLGALEKEPDIPGEAIACLRTAIAEDRKRLHVEMVHQIDRTDLEKLRKKTLGAAAVAREPQQAANDAAGRGGGEVTGRDSQQLVAARQRAARRAEALRAAIASAAGIYLPDRLHEVRIAIKKLRYAMEIARELSRSRATARIVALKEAQDLLGRMHDLEILIARTRAVQGAEKAPPLRLSADLDVLVRRLETECRQRHGHYMSSRNALLAICDYVTSMAARHRQPAA